MEKTATDERLLRRSRVSHAAISELFYVGFQASMHNAHFEVGHRTLVDGPRRNSCDRSPNCLRLSMKRTGADPLLAILGDATTEFKRWHERRPIVEAVRNGLLLVGQQAEGAIPVINDLFQQRPSPIANSAKDALRWQVTLARMGMPLDQLPHPDSWSEQMIARERESVQRRLAQSSSH